MNSAANSLASFPVNTAHLSAPNDPEYSRLLAGLENVVMPQLARVAAILQERGFTVTAMGQKGPLASLVIKGPPGAPNGWIYFQIHRSFGPLLDSQRVFWMYAVSRPHQPVAGQPGRLSTLNDAAAVRRITTGFASLFEMEFDSQSRDRMAAQPVSAAFRNSSGLADAA